MHRKIWVHVIARGEVKIFTQPSSAENWIEKNQLKKEILQLVNAITGDQKLDVADMDVADMEEIVRNTENMDNETQDKESRDEETQDYESGDDIQLILDIEVFKEKDY